MDDSLARAAELMRAGDVPAAEVVYRARLDTLKDDPAALTGLARCAMRRADFTEAADHFRRALRRLPHEGPLWIELAECQRRGGAGHAGHAVRSYEEGLRLMPADDRVMHNLAGLLAETGRHAESNALLLKAYALSPEPAKLRHLVGALLRSGNPFEALPLARRLAELPPGVGVPESAKHECLGLALFLTGATAADNGEAATLLRKAHDLDPTNPDIEHCLGLLDLSAGRYEQGFARLAARHRMPASGLTQSPGTAFHLDPFGPESLSGRSLRVVCEQGAGDAIQFARYLPPLRDRGIANLEVECPTPLATLIASTLPAGTVTATLPPSPTEPSPRPDVKVALLDLPRLLRLYDPTMPPAGYLATPSARVEWYRNRLSAASQKSPPATTTSKKPAPTAPNDTRDTPLFIGLCWSGNPQQPINDRRAIDPRLLAELLSIPSVSGRPVRFVSLQKLVPPGLPAPKGLIDLTPEVTDFSDTAALISALDLVITTDTSIAHLTGALAKPGWVLLHHPAPHWPYGLSGNTTPWYPTLRLFRQPAYGDWAPVVREVRSALQSISPPPADKL